MQNRIVIRGVSLVVLVTILSTYGDAVDPKRNLQLFQKEVVPHEQHDQNQEGLLLTAFHSLQEFEEAVAIQHLKNARGRHEVRLTHHANNTSVVSVLEEGVSEQDFLNARNGGWIKKLALGLRCPFAVIHKNDLLVIEALGRRRPWDFGKGDVAFYDLAEQMVRHIVPEDTTRMSAKELSDKGYLNTFNHITAQAFMTSVFSEEMADFVADVHERFNLPEMITGQFSEEQLESLETGPVDNYLDMINNEWGQELGKVLRLKFVLSKKTYWTPLLLADYLNEILSYYSWCFTIGFTPFTPQEEVVRHFSAKINLLMHHQNMG